MWIVNLFHHILILLFLTPLGELYWKFLGVVKDYTALYKITKFNMRESQSSPHFTVRRMVLFNPRSKTAKSKVDSVAGDRMDEFHPSLFRNFYYRASQEWEDFH